MEVFNEHSGPCAYRWLVVGVLSAQMRAQVDLAAAVSRFMMPGREPRIMGEHRRQVHKSERAVSLVFLHDFKTTL
jgi:hypothetical protein